MRRTINLMKDWIFIDDSGSHKSINLPHTWNNIDGQDGGNDYRRLMCTYEKNFEKPQYDEDERVYLQFHGVNASARVYLNGDEVYRHDNGYSLFRFDITEHLRHENLVKVEVDNSVNELVYPQRADFTFYGGIYRDVELLVVHKKHFELDNYGGTGVRITPIVEGNKGFVDVVAKTNNNVDDDGYNVGLELLDREGRVVAEEKGKRSRLTIDNPHLWEGISSPYLYQLKASVYKDGKIVDVVTHSIGFRTFEMHPDKGFILNGKPYPLRGVSKHQDWKGIGNAITKEHLDRDMELIREVGANTIRLAHYQHDQYFYNLCDQYGLVVWAEIPYISEHMEKGKSNTFFQMHELIEQNYNHPSIVTWGLSNEITISRKHKKHMLDNHHELQKLVKSLDPTRPTTLACYAMCSPFHPVSKISDIVGWNLYLGWYVPGLFLNDWFMKFYHKIYPNRCLSYSEYGAEGMPNLHSSHPRRGDHTEEYQAKYHEYMLQCFERHPFLWGTYVWNMFDFAADAREQGGEAGMNHKGLVTFDRKVKKDSFYLYKAWWSKEAFVHLAGKRYIHRTDKVTEITVYTNQKEVSLYHNNRLVETLKGEHVFKFKVPMDKENHIEVRSGNLSDSMVIYQCDKPLKDYILPKGKSKNWV